MSVGCRTHPRRASALWIGGVLLLAAACRGGPTEPGTAVVASVEVSPPADTLEALGATRQLSATAKDAQGRIIPGVSFTWASAAPTVATVSEFGGLVTAVGNGESSITATADGVSGSTLLAVSQVVSSVAVTPSSTAFVTTGVTQQLSAVASDANDSEVVDVRFLWVSSEPSVATVDSTGLVTARGPGSTVIAAAARGVPGYAEVTVTQTATRVAFSVQPSAVEAGGEISPAVEVEVHDGAGAVVATARPPVTLVAIDDAGDSVLLYGTGTVTAVAGISTFSGLSIHAARTLRLVASAAGMASDTSEAFVVSPGPVSAVSFSSPPPSVVEAGTTFAPAVVATVTDLYGNPISGADVTVTLAVSPSSSHQLGGTATRTSVGGAATFDDLSLARPASYALAAEVGSARTEEVPVLATMTVARVSAGLEATCALGASGAYCWGDNETGNLGAGTVGTSDSLPLLVSGSQVFTALSAGASHTCGLTATGAVYCWGNNGFGQLGDGGVENNVTTPTLVQGSGSGALVFTSVSAGLFHTCGLTTAQEAYCWGDNGLGQLGDSTNATRFAPARVAAGTTTFTQISAGSSHTCALDTGGAAHCWGYNVAGQLGTGVAGPDAGSDAPVPVSGGLTFSNVQAGSGHTCAIRSAFPGVYCWGDNGFGQLGDGTNTQRLEPWPSLAEATVLSVSEGHSCSVDPYGDAYCWGRNHRGQLGNGTSTNSSVPTPVLDGRAWSDISAGYSHSCAVSEGVAYCWGSNGLGELGDGSTTLRAYPARVAG